MSGAVVQTDVAKMQAVFAEAAADMLGTLWLIVRQERVRKGLSLRAAAEQIGNISASGLHRFERTGVCSLPNARRILHWLGSL